MADEATVKVSLPKAKQFRGRAYGPGREVEVPVRVAKAFGLTAPTAKAAKGARKPGK